jgi:hypothetical protein
MRYLLSALVTPLFIGWPGEAHAQTNCYRTPNGGMQCYDNQGGSTRTTPNYGGGFNIQSNPWPSPSGSPRPSSQNCYRTAYGGLSCY